MFGSIVRNTLTKSKNVVNLTKFNQNNGRSSLSSSSIKYYSSNNQNRLNNNNNFNGNNNSNKNNNRNSSWMFGAGAAAVAATALLGSILSLEEQNKDTTTTEKKEKIARPEDDLNIEKFKYVIIGGGTAAYYAVDKILEHDKQATILMISKEYEVPYQRPPLSKNLWANKDENVKETLEYSDWSGAKSKLLYEPESVYGNEVLQFIRNKRVVDIHLDGKVILLNDGTLVAYEKCLIATGGEPRKFNYSASDDPRITTYRTVDDFRKLHDVVHDDKVKHVTVIGGGFLGSEITCAINDNLKDKVKITQVFPENGVLPLIFPDYLSKYATDKVKASGVDVLEGRLVKDISKNNDKLKVQLDNGSSIDTDHVVVAVGIIPNTDIAKSTSLEVDPVNGGYVVNAELQARSNVYVAGDVASFYDYNLGVRRRVEHHDHAKATGELAGKNMAGSADPYTYLPFFWSDLTDHIGFEAVGNTDAKLKTYAVWEKQKTDDADKFSKGIIYYLNDKSKVVGVLTFRNYGKMDKARELITKGKPITNLEDLQHAISLEDEHH
ncbi:apoptosis inducing factor [Heterostelium album PN500]|uniref:Apoptosis inducing factor n=1 Tax=Heterostelium pallidum (strain ATCC 26659 / Pp 5 / PN500) TaxID=670386 RepID=D3B4D7_HETP5|nr:apoptosis inducing factor [Heterostelium album PN500]EFA84185.1 apoptosis inducing factor [Heterostelium album PN500]|eukprot:XP_020436302.1 apoptosis inducing factor [Heterostelium album PN500]